jgi:hypothetical protein
MPPELVASPFEPARRLRASNGSGHPASNGNGNSGSSGSGSSGNGSRASNGGNRKSAGAGLGLSIAKGIVQAHGGRIELTPITPITPITPVTPVTPLRQGTCFSVYLPVEAEVLDGSKLTGPRTIRGPADLGVTGDLEVAAKGGHTPWESKE